MPVKRITFGLLILIGIGAPVVLTDTWAAPVNEGVNRVPRRTGAVSRPNSPVMRKITLWQKTLHRRISTLVRSQKNGVSGGAMALLTGLAFVYGLIHALGPGHGKLILASCVIGREYRIRDVLKASALFTGVHNGSAIILYTFFILVFGMLRRRTTHTISTAMHSISGWLLVLLGTVLLVSVFLKKKEHTHKLPERVSRMSLPLATALAGLVPCPGTLVMLMFAGTLGLVWLGYLLALGFAAGMFLTLSGIAVMLASGRTFAAGPLKGETAVKVLRISGAVLLMIFGGYLVLLY